MLNHTTGTRGALSLILQRPRNAPLQMRKHDDRKKRATPQATHPAHPPPRVRRRKRAAAVSTAATPPPSPGQKIRSAKADHGPMEEQRVLAGPMCRRPPAFPSAPALSTRAPTYTPIRPQFSKVYGRKTSKYKQPSKFAALTAGPAAKK